VMVSVFAPFGPNPFDTVYKSELGGIPNSPAKARGISIGQQAAAAMLASRADEDIFAALGAPYTPGTKPGDYQPTPPVNMVVGAGWSKLRTFAVASSKQFRAPPPYSLRSLDYTMDFNEIKVLGKSIGSARTADQTAIAFFWYENSPFAWNRIAREVGDNLALLGHARLYAALNAALADAYITSLESKFHYNFWRPITAIHAAATDGNPLTVPEGTWEPAFATPPVPDYPSAHSAAGGAAAEVIDAMIGRNRPFTHVSTTGPISGVPGADTRSFSNVQNAAVENAYSRMLVGIHFRRACTVGLAQGRDIGHYVVEHADFLRD
jgi:PAP2 superfamily protein